MDARLLVRRQVEQLLTPRELEQIQRLASHVEASRLPAAAARQPATARNNGQSSIA